MIKPIKKLGQNFLKNKNIALKIVSLIDNANTIIEIGAGKGILSEILFQKFSNVYFIEIDKRCIDYLTNIIHIPLCNIIHANFLKLNLNNFKHPLTIVGNIPYNITSPVLFKILENIHLIDTCVLMIQLEVADRLISQPNSKDYGILSVLFQRYFKVEKKFVVHPSCFFPQPKVFSSVIKCTKIQNITDDYKFYKKIVKTAFNQRRKVLLNSLGSLFTKNTLPEKYHKLRAENLSIDDYIYLTNLYIKHEKKS